MVRRGRCERGVPARRSLGARDHPHARPVLSPPRDRYVYYPGTADVPEQQAVNIRNRSFVIGALVDIPGPGAQGVLFAQGALFGGHALYVKDNRLHYVNNFVGRLRAEGRCHRRPARRREPDPVRVVRQGRRGSARRRDRTPVAVSRRHEGRRGSHQDPARGSSRSPAKACASGATVVRAVTADYPGVAPFRFTGGTIKRVAVDVSGEPYLDLEREAAGDARPE